MRRRLISVIMALAALVLIALFLDNSVFVIRDVRVIGDSGMDEIEVVRLAEVDLGADVLTLGVPDRFISHASRAQQLTECGLEPEAIAEAVERRLKRK